MSDFFGEHNESGAMRGHVGPATNAKASMVGSCQEFPAALRGQGRGQLAADAESSWLSLEAAALRSGIHPSQLKRHVLEGRLLGGHDQHDPLKRLHISASSFRQNLRALRHRTVE